MDQCQREKSTTTPRSSFWDMTPDPTDLPGIIWKPLDESERDTVLQSKRGAVLPSLAHPIIGYIRAVGTPPPGIYGPAKRSYNSTLLLECRQCGNPFTEKKGEVRKKAVKGESIFCSTECAAESFSRRYQTRFCFCGSPIPNSRRVYCSDSCEESARRDRAKKKDCPQCGKTFVAHSSRTIFCGKKCADAAHSIRMRGTGNSWHRKAASPTHHFTEIKPAIKARDANMCAICTSTERLVVHHCNEDPADNRPENLITLCNACHQSHHHGSGFPWLGALAMVRSTTSK